MGLHRATLVSCALILWAAIAGLGALAVGQAGPAGPATVAQAAFPLNVKAGAYDLITVVFDFAPGSGVPKHIHGGPVVVTVLSGEMTLQQGGGEKVVKAGESWTEKPGDVHAVVNKSEGITRVAVSLLLPKGAAATTLVK